MKRYIKSSNQFTSRYHIKNWHGTHQDYIVYASGEDDPSTMSLQVSELHPYDDAHYASARFDNAKAMYIKDGEILKVQNIGAYNQEDYESTDEYLDYVIDKIIITLQQLNKDVKPKIMHF